jgi:uncharacterized protein YjbJ (UPF0337 family)
VARAKAGVDHAAGAVKACRGALDDRPLRAAEGPRQRQRA